MSTASDASFVAAAGSETRVVAARRSAPARQWFALLVAAVFGPRRIAIHDVANGTDRDRWIDCDGR